MNYQDDFSVAFPEKEGFLEFLDEIEERGCWRVFPTNEIQVLALVSCKISAPSLSASISRQNSGDSARENTWISLVGNTLQHPRSSIPSKNSRNPSFSGKAAEKLS